MSYFLHRQCIKSGDIILWQGTGIAARIIRFFTGSKWSHVGIAVWWGSRLMVLDSYPFSGTRARPLATDLKGAYWLPVGDGEMWTGRALDYALKQLGRPYSWQNLWKTWLGLALVKREYTCAQYAADVLMRMYIAIPQPATPWGILENFSKKPVQLEKT